MVGGRRVGAPAGGVQRLALRAGADRVARDACLVLALVGQERAVVDVARRVEPVRALDPAGVVHGEPAAGFQADRLQAQVAGARGAAGGEEDLVGLHALAVVEFHGDRAVATRTAYGGGRDARTDLRSGLGQRLGDQLPGERLHPGQQAIAAYEHGDLRTERVPDGGHLHTDDSPADHDEPAGDLLGARRLAARPRAGVLDAGEVGDHGPAARADGDGVPGGEPVFRAVGRGDGDLFGAGQPAVAAEDVGPDPVEPSGLAVVLPVRGVLVAMGEDGGGVQRSLDGAAQAGDAAGVGAGDDGAQERLARHAGPVGALASDQFRLDHGGGQPGGPGPVRHVLTHRTRSDDHDVVRDRLRSMCHAAHSGGGCGRRPHGQARNSTRSGTVDPDTSHTGTGRGSNA